MQMSERALTAWARQTAAMNKDSANLHNPGSERRIRCALFVDFDNVYLGLRRLDPPAAEAFANDPGQWLERLETGRDAEGEFRTSRAP